MLGLPMQQAGPKRAYIRSIYLILIMVSITMAVLGTAIALLYHTAFEVQRSRLIEVAQSRARMIEAIARHEIDNRAEDPLQQTLRQLREAHGRFPGFGDTGEFALARLEGTQIVFLISHRRHDTANPHPVPVEGDEAEPMRRALHGEAGSIVGPDYAGVTVLAAFEPVSDLNLGIVAKIDLAEIRAPFVRAAFELTCFSFLLIVLGAWVFRRITARTAHRLEESEKLFRETFSHAAIGLAHVSLEGSWLRVNNALCELLGYSCDELRKLTFQDITHPDDLDADLQLLKRTLSGEINTYTMEKRYIRKDGTTVSAQLTVSLVRDSQGKPDYFVSAVADISALKQAMSTIKTISGIVPLCAWCGNSIRTERGEWVRVEKYFEENTNAEISHGMCPKCREHFEKNRRSPA